MPERSATPQQVQFDFDGVFVRRDSTAAFIARELRGRPVRLVLALGPAAAYLATQPLPRLQGRLARLLLRLTMYGMDLDHVRASLSSLAGELARDERVTVQPALDAMRQALARGDHVLVNSASFEDFLIPFLAAHDLQPAIAGSTLRLARRGIVMARHNHGREKVRTASALGWLAPNDIVISDSISDLPLLATARTAVLVDVAPRIARRVRQSITAEVEVVRWR